jgi:photosystem II stability/assembly factor-like uncharacterized protein
LVAARFVIGSNGAVARWVIAAVLLSAEAAAQDIWISGGLDGQVVTALVASHVDPSRLYAGTEAGVFRSIDSGRSWDPTADELPAGAIRALAPHPTDSAILYAGTSTGVFRTEDAGASWIESSTGMAPGAVLQLAIDPATPETIWAHTDEPGLLHVYRSTDGGDSWASFLIQGPGFGTPTFGSIVGLAVHPQNGRVYAAWHEIVFYNDDGGQVWSRYSDVDHELQALLLDPFDASVTYVGTFDAGVGKSSDFGPWTFAAGLAALRVTKLAAEPFLPNDLYAATFDGRVFHSRDGGATFTELARLPVAPNALLVTHADGRLRAATPFGILRTGSPSEIERLPIQRAQPKGGTRQLEPR